MTQRWEPVLDGADRDRALEITSDIATAVRDAPGAGWHGLMGDAGIAMFLADAEAASLGEDLGALDLLERGLAELTRSSAQLGLWTGATGLRWAVSQLAAGDHGTELLAHLDRGILARLAGAALDDYDLYAGLAGVLLAYADDAACGDRVVSRVLDHLERIDLFPPKRNELGCAHGVAGLLGALAGCHAHGRADDRVLPLMLAIVAALKDLDVTDQRIGWCRGESGIALSLLGAARVLGRDDLEDHAIEVALAPFTRHGGRWPVDAGLCHGAAGLGHLCNRMYQATGDGRFADHARTWLRKTMAMQNPGRGIAGFTMFRARPEPMWEADPSLLVGVSGVGLALLAGATAIVPSWDRALGADIGDRL